MRTDGRTDFGSCDDFHFSGLIESVSSALAALIEWAYLTDLSAGAELTYLPFAACRGSCSRSEWKESPQKNGMDGPIEFALPLKGGERRKKTDQYRGQRRKICFARGPCKWARNASLNSTQRLNRRSNYKAAFSLRQVVSVYVYVAAAPQHGSHAKRAHGVHSPHAREHHRHPHRHHH